MSSHAPADRTRMHRLTALLAVLALITSGLLLGGAGSAAASSDAVACTPTSSSVATFNPPLTSTEAPTTITASRVYSPCVSALYPQLISGTSFGVRSVPRSCLDLLASSRISWTIDWNTGQSSDVVANGAVNIVGAVVTVTYTGTVVSGLFAGDTLVQQEVGPATSILECTLGLGTVSSFYATMTLVIV